MEYWNNGMMESAYQSITPIFHYFKVRPLRSVKFFLLLILIAFSNAYAQFDNYHLDFKAVVKSGDGVQKLVLFNRGNIDDVIDGYVLISRGTHDMEGRIKKGGFNFLDPKIFEVGLPSLRRTWVKNNFPVKNIEVMTNGVDVEKVYSFEVTPEILNIKSDSISFYIKGVFYDLTKQTDKYSEYNLNYNINLTYKLFTVPYNKSVRLDFFCEQFNDYSFSVKFNKIDKDDEYLSIQNNRPLFEGIEQSASESSLPPNVRIEFGTEYIRADVNKPADLITLLHSDYLLTVQQHSLVPVNALDDRQFGDKTDLPVDIYYTDLSFPFKLYNKEKAELYKNYKTKSEIFKSNYNIVIVPISLNADTITADVLLNYTKINLNDNIPRWTPIRKRVKLIRGFPVAINLPKENWSASFTRDREKYSIYGYSDFEQYVNEYLVVSFDSIKQTDGE